MLESAEDNILANMRLLSILISGWEPEYQLNIRVGATLGTLFLAARRFQDDRIVVHGIMCYLF